MDSTQLNTVFSLTTILIMGAIFVVVIWRMQATIDTLSSKLMARDFKEYATLAVPAGPEQKPSRLEQLSWYDDPHEPKEGNA